MDITDIRRKNMLSLLEQYKTQAEFANLVGTDPSYISQLKKGVKKTGERVAMGDDLARGIEIALDLPYGVMDRQNTIINNNGGVNILGNNHNHGTQIQNHHTNNTYTTQDDGWLIITSADMFPTFQMGDRVRIDVDKQPQAGNYVFVDYDGQHILRKYRPKFDDDGKPYVQLVACNEDYPVIDSRHQNFQLAGVAVEYKRKLV